MFLTCTKRQMGGRRLVQRAYVIDLGHPITCDQQLGTDRVRYGLQGDGIPTQEKPGVLHSCSNAGETDLTRATAG
jgi:hypothetical protein